MPIVPQPTHQAGDYPDTIRFITNGDPANQTFLRQAQQDLDFRTEVTKDFVNDLEATVISNFNTLDAFDKNHDHSGSNGEQLVDFNQIYSNSSQVDAKFTLANDGSWRVRNDADTEDLIKLDDAGTTDDTKIIFPGSVAVFAHRDAAASDHTGVNPHSLELAGRVLTMSSGCTIDGSSNGPYTKVTLDPSLAIDALFAAPELLGKVGSAAGTVEGVLDGDLTSPGGFKNNIVLIRVKSSDTPILDGGNPVYGLLENTGTQPSPIWELSFFANGAVHNFNADALVTLYGQEAYSLTTVPIVDPGFVKLCQEDIAL